MLSGIAAGVAAAWLMNRFQDGLSRAIGLDQSGETAIIASGLKPNDHVVVEGQLRLRNGAKIQETVASAADAPSSGDAAADAPQ